MQVLDSLALWGRKYQAQAVPSTGSRRFSLNDLLEMFDRNAIFELTPVKEGKAGPTVRPDPVRKIKVSLLDSGISAIHSPGDDWYEVLRTPPDGEVSKVKIVAHAGDGKVLGEIRMLVGQRTAEHYFEHDPILEQLRQTT